MFKFLFWSSPCILFMYYHGLFMYFKRTWNSLSHPIPIGGALKKSKQIPWYLAVLQKSTTIIGYQKRNWTISQLSTPMYFTAARLLGGQVKATNFISSCSCDTMLKKGSFPTQTIHPQLTEIWLFHFGLLKLKSKHFALASRAEAFCFKSV